MALQNLAPIDLIVPLPPEFRVRNKIAVPRQLFAGSSAM